MPYRKCADMTDVFCRNMTRISFGSGPIVSGAHPMTFARMCVGRRYTGDGPSHCDRLDAVCLRFIVNRTHALKAEIEDVWRHHNVVVCETFRA